MANGNFSKVLAETLKHEGGWSDHPDDPGNATMRGVTIGVFAEFKGRNVTKAELHVWRSRRSNDLSAGFGEC